MQHTKIFTKHSGFRKKVTATFIPNPTKDGEHYVTETVVSHVGSDEWRPAQDKTDEPSTAQISQVQHELWAKLAPPKLEKV